MPELPGPIPELSGVGHQRDREVGADDEAREDVAQHHRPAEALEEDGDGRRDTEDDGEGAEEDGGVLHQLRRTSSCAASLP